MLRSEHETLENAPIKESKPSKVEIPQKQNQGSDALKDPSRKLDRYGMVYCYFHGLWVFRSKCDDCKEWKCEVKKKKQEVQP